MASNRAKRHILQLLYNTVFKHYKTEIDAYLQKYHDIGPGMSMYDGEECTNQCFCQGLSSLVDAHCKEDIENKGVKHVNRSSLSIADEVLLYKMYSWQLKLDLTT